jgi:hypothetical protein
VRRRASPDKLAAALGLPPDGGYADIRVPDSDARCPKCGSRGVTVGLLGGACAFGRSQLKQAEERKEGPEGV